MRTGLANAAHRGFRQSFSAYVAWLIERDAAGAVIREGAAEAAITPRTTDEPAQPYGDRTEIFHHEIPPAPRKPRAKKKS